MTDPFAQPLFIFEMANNHQGSVAHGERIIAEMASVAKRRGVRAGIKFQFRDLDTFLHPGELKTPKSKHTPRFLGTRLSDADFRRLAEAARRAGLLVVATPFDEPSVQACMDRGIDIVKIASCSATDWPLIEAVAAAGKPVVASTGGILTPDIDNLVTFFGHRGLPLAVLHCVAIYPAPRDRLNLNFIAKLKRRYPGIPIGYSGHEAPDDTDVVKLAVAKGATVLERHVGMPAEGVSLNAYSASPEQADRWVESAVSALRICGLPEGKEVADEERASLRELMRGTYARRTIRKGETIGRDDVYFAMPCGPDQTTSGAFGRYRAVFTASRDYAPDEALRESSAPDPVGEIRGIIHDAKGLLSEAGIDFGKDSQIELSHHYGVENFRKFGALIVNVINREYCKKILVMLPRQKHPTHRHLKKEETFHVLWGALDVVLNGNPMRLATGDKLLIERGSWHSFWSDGGAIVEEISTTHIVGDSQYEDEKVARLDPMKRKTILDEW